MPNLYHTLLFQDGGRYHIEKNKSMDWFLYDNGLRLERVNILNHTSCKAYLTYHT